MPKTSLIVAGIMGRFPVGGVTWSYLQYIAGFQRLGYEVFYLEDTGECGYDPITNQISKDPSYAVQYIPQQLKTIGLENRWVYIDHMGRYHGKTREQALGICHQSDLMVNVSGGCWFARPEYDSLKKIFIDTDPGFHHLGIAEGQAMDKDLTGYESYSEFFNSYDTLFTFGLNIGHPSCKMANTPFSWYPTIQPLVLDFWPVVSPPHRAPFTTVLSWHIDSFAGRGKGKSREILQLIDLPSKCSQSIVLAIAGQAPLDLLRQHGWGLRNAVTTTIDPLSYRSFIQQSKAELGFAKAMYVETRSGWFSDRTECYLASGRPALVRDTGFGDRVPCGEGLLTFSSKQGILDGMEEIEGNYEHHCQRAREIVQEYFSAEKVLARLLEQAGF